jgi:organic hydroperoxide reductase OsmC/OhrA
MRRNASLLIVMVASGCWAACFGTTLALVGQRGNLKADDAEIDSSVSLIPGDGGRFQLKVELHIAQPVGHRR